MRALTATLPFPPRCTYVISVLVFSVRGSCIGIAPTTAAATAVRHPLTRPRNLPTQHRRTYRSSSSGSSPNVYKFPATAGDPSCSPTLKYTLFIVYWVWDIVSTSWCSIRRASFVHGCSYAVIWWGSRMCTKWFLFFLWCETFFFTTREGEWNLIATKFKKSTAAHVCWRD